MNGAVDVLEVLRRANPVPPGSVDEAEIPTAAELEALVEPGLIEVRFPDGSAPSPRRGWQPYAAAVAVVAAGVAALSLVPRGEDEPVTTAPPPSPLFGSWMSTDVDGSTQTMEITPSATGEIEIVVLDDSAQVCLGASSTTTGSGALQPDGSLLIPRPELVCDDGSSPSIVDGPPVGEALADLTFVHDDATDELNDNFGVVWWRVGSEPAASGGMWPQSTADEVRDAQRLADQGDPAATWQVDPGLLPEEADVAGSEILARFLREEIGWDASHLASIEAVGEGSYDGVLFIRCAAGETNALYPNHPEIRECAPTIDDLEFEAVQIDLRQPVQQGPTGVWVVSRWVERSFVQVAPPSDVDATAVLEEFLAARVGGSGADAGLDVEIPLLYATASGATYERFEVVEVGDADWPDGDRTATIRLFADRGATVVEQRFLVSTDPTGAAVLEYADGGTTQNGQAVPEPYTFLDGEVTFDAARPWDHSYAGWDHGPIVTTLLLGGAYEEGFAVVADPLPVATGCEAGPSPANAAALAGSILADPDLTATEPVAVTVAGIQALLIDVATVPGASVCAEEGTPIALAGEDWAGLRIDHGQRLRLYLLDIPAGSARVLAIAVYAPEARFDAVSAAATPIVDSVELHPR